MISLYRILYVDDEPSLLEIGKLFLENNQGFSVDCVQSGLDALDKISAGQYDAMVSDYQMPGIDGITLLKKVRATDTSLPFILFTGRGREEVVIEALNNGADFYLQKGGEPVSQFTELAHKIRQAIQQRRAEANIRDHERREADIINFLPDATFAIDTQGIVIAWNHAMEEMAGVRASEMLGKGNYEYALPIYHERRPILIDLVLQDNPAIAAEYPSLKRDGRTLIAENTSADLYNGRGATIWFTATPLYNSKGTIVGAIESIRDITGRKQVEDDLKMSRFQLAEAMDLARLVNWELDVTAGIFTFDDRFYAFFGTTAVAEGGTRMPVEVYANKFVHPDDRHMVVDEIQNAMQTTDPGYRAQVEHRIVRKDGGMRYIVVRIGITKDPEGRTIKIHGAHQDITERRNAEEALRESEARYRRLIETANEGVWVVDRDLNTSFVNQRFADMLGYSRGEMAGHNLLDYVISEDRAIMKSQFVARRNGMKSCYECKLLHKDGRTVWTMISGSPLLDDTGSFQGSFGMITDISEHKRAETALRESEERYREFFTVSRDSVFITSPEGRWIDFNDALMVMFGYESREEMAEVPVGSIYANPEDRTRFLALVEKDGYVKEYPVQLKKKDGTIIDTLITAVPVRNPDGSLRAFIGTIRDVTEVKRIAEDAKRSHEELAASFEQITATEEELRQTLDQLTLQERELRESEESYRTVFENTGAATVVLEENSIISLANAEFIKLSGISRDAIEGKKSWTEFVVKEDLDRMLAQHRLRRQDNESALRHYEFRFVTGSGDLHDIWLTVGVIPETKKSIASLLDITELKRAEEKARKAHEDLETAYEELTATEEEMRQNLDELATIQRLLSASEENYRTVFENTGNATIVLEENGIISLANEEFAHLSGFSKDEIERKKSWTWFVFNEDLELMLARNRQRLQDAKKALTHYEFRFVTRAGDLRDIWLTIGVITGTTRSVASLMDITDRKRAEAALRESEEKFRTVADFTIDWEYWIAPDGNYIYISPSCERVTGYRPEEFTRNPDLLITLIHPDDRARVVDHLAHKEINIGEHDLLEFRIISRSGEERWISHKCLSVFGRNNEYLGNRGSNRDITKRRKAEEALAESRRQLDAMATNVPGIVYRFCVNPDGTTGFDYISGRSRQILGIENDPATFFDKVTEGIVPENRDRFISSVRHTISAKTPWEFESPYVRPSGETIWLSAASSPLMENGRLVFDGVIFDITDRKRAEQELRDAALNWQTTFDSTQDAICLFDADQRIIRCNKTMQEILGATHAEDLIGRPCWEVVHGTAGPLPGCPHFLMQKSLRRETLELEMGDRWYIVVTDPILDERQNLVGAVHSMRDITERRHAEKALLRANRKLALLSGITRHDITNQLMILKGFTELLHGKVTDPSLEYEFSRIINASTLISAMIRFTKEYEEIGVKAPVWQDCRALIDTAAKEALPGTIGMINDLPAGAEVFADPLIVKVWYNLMDNAVRYGGKITTIRFSVQERNRDHIMVCEDDGDGVPVHEKEKIFERGFGKNTGLGLTLAREILDITSITISETGEPGKGARFEIVVPKGAYRVAGHLS